jgi:hypothetical protein
MKMLMNLRFAKKRREFLDWSWKYWLLKEDYAAWRGMELEACHRLGKYPTVAQINPVHTNISYFFRPVLYSHLPLKYFQVAFFMQVFRPKLCMCFKSLLYVLHAHPTLLDFIFLVILNKSFTYAVPDP